LNVAFVKVNLLGLLSAGYIKINAGAGARRGRGKQVGGQGHILGYVIKDLSHDHIN
jgi:hypothetical protein